MELTPSEIEVMGQISHIENVKRDARIEPACALFSSELCSRFPHYTTGELQVILNSLYKKGVVSYHRTANDISFSTK